MATLTVSPHFGFVLAELVVLYLWQNAVLAGFVAKARKATRIKAPTLYPRDSQIKELKLNDEQVTNYMQAQRAHLNTVEFTSAFTALFVVAGLLDARATAIAGAVVVLGRILGGIGYQYGKRGIGGFFHLGELYVLYIVGSHAYRLISTLPQ